MIYNLNLKYRLKELNLKNSSRTFYGLVLLFLLLPYNNNAQLLGYPEIKYWDSISTKTYQQLYTSIRSNVDNDYIFDLGTKTFLSKAYSEKDTLRIATGYYIITSYNKERFVYLNDSLVKYAPFVNGQNWLWAAYDNMGGYYYRRRNFQKAFSNHVRALEIAKKYSFKKLTNISRVNLGLLKERVGKNKEALEDFRDSYKYRLNLIDTLHLDKANKSDLRNYLNIMSLLANSYRLNHKLDSATYINTKIQSYKDLNLPEAEKYITVADLSMAEINFDCKNYRNVIEKVDQLLPTLIVQKNLKNAGIAYHIRGISYYKIGNYERGLHDLIKMDSIFSVLGDLYPTVRSGFVELVDTYHNKHELEKELYYRKQLSRFDSIIHHNYAYIQEGITEEIEKPAFTQNQNKLETLLHTSDLLIEKNNRKLITWIVLSIILLGGLTYLLIRKQKVVQLKENEKIALEKKYQEQFDKLLKSRNVKSETVETINSLTDVSELGIAESVVNEILDKLDHFKQNHGFLDVDITATKLANELNTNANYLGRIIKYKYNKGFRNYINSLRAELALSKLRNDPSFRNYSVSAMAKEVGFRNTEPFSKAFKESTGLYPSEFLQKAETP